MKYEKILKYILDQVDDGVCDVKLAMELIADLYDLDNSNDNGSAAPATPMTTPVYIDPCKISLYSSPSTGTPVYPYSYPQITCLNNQLHGYASNSTAQA